VVVLRFRDGVRARLQELLPEPDAWRTYEALMRHITSHAGPTATFAAAVYDPLGDLALLTDLQPFAAAATNRILLTTDGKAEFDQLAGVRSEVIRIP